MIDVLLWLRGILFGAVLEPVQEWVVQAINSTDAQLDRRPRACCLVLVLACVLVVLVLRGGWI